MTFWRLPLFSRLAPDSLFYKAFNICLRLLSLASKLILTLYMGRYLCLSDMGVYGLVFGAVMVTSVILGGRLDFVVARDIVGTNGTSALIQMRDEALFYAASYVLFALVMLGLWQSGLVAPHLLLIVFVLSILENLANMSSANLVSLDRPLLSTFLFFIRGGLWGLAIAVVGLCFPAARHVSFVFLAWALGATLSLLLTLFSWRHLPWHEALRAPIDWVRLKKAALQSFPIWLGTLGSMAALYVDRFVASYALDLEQVGIITFFGSFAAALLSLAQSGFFAFSFPRLVRAFRTGDEKAFRAEERKTTRQVDFFVFCSAIVLGLSVPLLARLLGKDAIAAESVTLWLLLLGICLRGHADSLYYVLYARKLDRANWTGGLLFLIPACAGNMILIPLYGLEGAGYSAILSAGFLLIWRFYFAHLHPLKKISCK